MVRQSLSLLLALINLSCAADHYFVEAPPTDSSAKAGLWWNEFIDRQDLQFLTVLSEVSEIHKQNGTTACYLSFFTGCGGLRSAYGLPIGECPRSHIETRISVPVPQQAEGRIKERLAGQALGPSDRWKGPFWHGKGGMGCSDAQAQEIWDRAVKKHGW